MHAVIKTGGKQYRVTTGQTLKVEKLPAEVGAAVEINDVLMLSADGRTEVGRPFVTGGKVLATVKAQGRGPKVEILKFRRRKHYRKQMGHRQSYTELQIDSITGPGFAAASTPAVAAAPVAEEAEVSLEK